MRLFKVGDKVRVRITSKLIHWVEHGRDTTVAENLTWEGTTTDRYYFYKGAHRRLITNHTVDMWGEYGIWQRDTDDCEIIEDMHVSRQVTRGRRSNGGIIMD